MGIAHLQHDKFAMMMKTSGRSASLSKQGANRNTPPAIKTCSNAVRANAAGLPMPAAQIMGHQIASIRTVRLQPIGSLTKRAEDGAVGKNLNVLLQLEALRLMCHALMQRHGSCPQLQGAR